MQYFETHHNTVTQQVLHFSYLIVEDTDSELLSSLPHTAGKWQTNIKTPVCLTPSPSISTLPHFPSMTWKGLYSSWLNISLLYILLTTSYMLIAIFWGSEQYLLPILKEELLKIIFKHFANKCNKLLFIASCHVELLWIQLIWSSPM